MLIVVIEAVASSGAEAERILTEARALIGATRAEEGCLSYAFSQDCIDAGTVRVSERWRDEPAMAAHMKSAHLAQFMTFLSGVSLKSLTAKVYDASGERDLFG